MNNPQYIYSMYKLSKVYPGGKQVIKDMSLSFLPGAKIGVLGGNGAGKSTLLKIMAGVDSEYNGEAKLADGIKVGYLSQEPELNNSLNVYENVMEGMAEAKKLVDDFNAISLKFSEDLTEDEMNQVIDELNSRVKKQNEILCVNAIRTVFENIDNLDFLNKRAIYVYIREISGLNSKQLSVAMSKIRKHYKQINNRNRKCKNWLLRRWKCNNWI